MATKPKNVGVEARVVKSKIPGAATIEIMTPGGRKWSLFLNADETRRIREELHTISREAESA
jgi:hypothetical protein